MASSSGTQDQPISHEQQQEQSFSQQRQQQYTTKASTTAVDYEPWSDSNVQQVVALWDLSTDNESKLRDFQRRVADVDHSWNDPHILLRYMFAPHGYSASEKLFRNMIAWRIKHRVDTILQNYTPPPVLLRYASPLAFLNGYDKDGDPIYIERGGSMDGQGLLRKFPADELMRHAIWLRELQSSGPWVDDYERRQGKSIKDITVIFDLKGLSMRHYNPSVLAFFQSHMKMTEDYYPGPIKRIIIIRAPTMFRIIWGIVKHFFPQTARDKMTFAGPANYLEVLEQYIDKDVLPAIIHPMGKGELALGMSHLSLEAGRIPDSIGYGGKGYVSPIAPISGPVAPAPPVIEPAVMLPQDRKPSTNSSTRTGDTSPADVSYSQEEEEELTGQRSCLPQCDWEETCWDGSDGVYVLWHEPTGIEITHQDFMKDQNLISL